MEELLTCSMNCQNKSVYICECSGKKVLLCSNHAGPHGTSKGSHHFVSIVINPDPPTKVIISKFLKGLKQQSKQDRLKIIQESSLLIKQIEKEAIKSLEKLLVIEKKLDEYIYLCSTSGENNNLNTKSFIIESALKLSAEDVSKIKYEGYLISINNANFKEKIENLFTVKETKSLFDVDTFWVVKPSVIKYFKSNNLTAVDVISQNSTSQNVNKISSWGTTCLLDDGSIFGCLQSDTFIIAPNNSIIPLDSSRYSNTSGLIAIDDFVYMFGGGSNASLKFSLKPKNWTVLAQYPVSGNHHVSCAHINGVILIGGHSNQTIYGYIVSINLFAYVPIALNASAGKTCLATKSRAYVIEYSRNYYESGLNDITSWTSIGNANMLDSGWPCNSYSLLYEDSFYFITCNFKLIQFDLKTKQLKHLKTYN